MVQLALDGMALPLRGCAGVSACSCLQRAASLPQLRYMGSKYRLLPWIHQVLSELDFLTALDPFSGSGCVAYLLKAMGKEVTAADFLHFPQQIAAAAIENSSAQLTDEEIVALLAPNHKRKHFVQKTFSGIFFTPEDLDFIDNTWANIDLLLVDRRKRAIAVAALVRAAVKKQPRGVFTVAGDPERYKDGRRDLRLSLCEHFVEGVHRYNATVFDNGNCNQAIQTDVFSIHPAGFDLVYMDPPYVPRADDNCYIKRYHFLEGLASYWRNEGTGILVDTKVRKIPKRFTPFSYRRTALDAFDCMFSRFATSILVLSYSSNGYPDLNTLVGLMRKHKRDVTVFERRHRYHFGTHEAVAKERATVLEYLIVGH